MIIIMIIIILYLISTILTYSLLYLDYMYEKNIFETIFCILLSLIWPIILLIMLLCIVKDEIEYYFTIKRLNKGK